MKFAILLLLSVLAAQDKPAEPPPADLSRIEAEPNLEKRARAALDNADDALRQAEEAYAKGDNAETSARLGEVGQSVELANRSLIETHKNPSRSPKHFKQAELRIRALLRKLDGFGNDMSVVDRPVLERVASSVQRIHDGLLDSIMGKRK